MASEVQSNYVLRPMSNVRRRT